VDDEALAAYADALADAVEQALPGWVERSVERVMVASKGECPDETRAAAARAGEAARSDVGPRVRALLASDVDEQRTNPLAIVRGAVRYPTEVLRQGGVPPVRRDEFAEQQFPDDDYDLTPASFAEIDPTLHEPGLVWGAAKAHVVLARRRAEGKR
jgi:hypothetical protein